MIASVVSALGTFTSWLYRVLMYRDIWLYCVTLLSIPLLIRNIPFSLVLREDAFLYVVKGMEIAHGDLSPDRLQMIGWPLVLGAVYFVLDVGDVFEAMFIARWTTVTIIAACVFLLGKLCMKIFARQGHYALVIAIVVTFVFAVRIGEAARDALAEPLFMLCTIIMVWMMIEAFAKDPFKPGYLALASLVAAFAYWVRPNGLFLFAAMGLFIVLVLRKHRLDLLKACLIAAGVFLLATLPYLYSRYAAFGSPFDYGANSKYFVDHFHYAWAENVEAPSFWQYLKTHDWAQYYHKFVRQGLLVVLYYLQIGLLPILWVVLAVLGAVTIFLTRTKALYFAPLSILVSILGMSLIFHTYGTIRHLIYLIPLLLITAGALFLILDRVPFDIKNLVGTCVIALAIVAAPSSKWWLLYKAPKMKWWNSERIAVPQVKDHWAVWAAAHLQGNVAILEGSDLISMSEHYRSRGWRIGENFERVQSRINLIRPGVYTSLEEAHEAFRRREINYLVTDDVHIHERPYLKDVSKPKWGGVFRHMKHFPIGDKGAVLKNVDIYEVVY